MKAEIVNNTLIGSTEYYNTEVEINGKSISLEVTVDSINGYEECVSDDASEWNTLTNDERSSIIDALRKEF